MQVLAAAGVEGSASEGLVADYCRQTGQKRLQALLQELVQLAVVAAAVVGLVVDY